ncbi:hypothetical protein GYMLUDRAFT_182429, partial [Collybiopsis luxurians FD-317 M1]
SLFATILKDCNPTQPGVLWNQFKQYICDDLEHYLHREKIVEYPSQSEAEDYGLYLIDKILFHTGVFEGVMHY